MRDKRQCCSQVWRNQTPPRENTVRAGFINSRRSHSSLRNLLNALFVPQFLSRIYAPNAFGAASLAPFRTTLLRPKCPKTANLTLRLPTWTWGVQTLGPVKKKKKCSPGVSRGSCRADSTPYVWRALFFFFFFPFCLVCSWGAASNLTKIKSIEDPFFIPLLTILFLFT